MTRSRWLGAGLFGLAVGLAATALLGPLGAGVIRYRVSGLMLSQLKGVDVVSLVLIAPLCAVIGLLAMGGRRAAPALALGPAVYVLYMFAETILGPDYLGVAGNNERFFPLFVAMFVLAAAVLITAWNQIDPSELGSPRRRANRVAGGLFVALGAFLVLGRYLPGLADAMSTKPTNTDYLAGPTIYWTIALEDLGVVIPAMIAVGVGMWRGRSWAARARFAVAGWAALIPVAVASMAASMYADNQPSASLSAMGLLSIMAAVFLVPATLCYLPLRHQPSRDASHADVDVPRPPAIAA
jgi:hypothetical protein